MAPDKDEWTLSEDPYDILGVPPDATDSQIAKAYRKRALKLHPDKNPNASQEAFHELQVAKAFLDNPTAKRRYDRQRESKISREKAQKLQQERLSQRQKQFRSSLHRAEEEAAFSVSKKPKTSHSNKRAEELRKKGQELRQKRAEKVQEQEIKLELEIQQRQVKCKWSRKKSGIRTQEDLRQRLDKYGKVDEIGMLKDNAAVATFGSVGACRLAVEDTADSKEIRITHVVEPPEPEPTSQPAAKSASEDWKLRHAAQREQLLRSMERGENDVETPTVQVQANAKSNFPPDFEEELVKLATPWERLLAAEKQMFPEVFSQPT